VLSEWAVRTPSGVPAVVVPSIVDAHSSDRSLAPRAAGLTSCIAIETPYGTELTSGDARSPK